MNFMGIIATEYHVVDTWVVLYGHSLGIIHRDNHMVLSVVSIMDAACDAVNILIM